MKDGRLSARGKLVQVGIWLGLICGIAFVLNISLIGIQSGLLPTARATASRDHPRSLRCTFKRPERPPTRVFLAASRP